jgi:hypothetical protein
VFYVINNNDIVKMVEENTDKFNNLQSLSVIKSVRPELLYIFLSYWFYPTLDTIGCTMYIARVTVDKEFCTLCLQDINGECLQTKCNHYFHTKCVVRHKVCEWLYKNKSYPNCREILTS